MENTLENKYKYFAQHWGQLICVWQEGGVKGALPRQVLRNYSVNDFHLELTPLSEITDEDAIEINRLTDGRAPLNKSLLIDALNYNHDGIVATVADRLRGKGFAISFNGLSVEQLTEYGWLKLKTKP